LLAANPYDKKGWVVQCSSSRVAKEAAGTIITINNYPVYLTMFAVGGVTIYIIDHINNDTVDVLAEGVAKIKQV